MFEREKEVLVKDCQECDYVSSPTISKECRNCIGKQKFDRLRLVTKYFTKEYDRKYNLLSVEPFFIDVRFNTLVENATYVDEYFLSTGAKVTIFKKEDGVGYIYFVNIPEMNITFNELPKFHELVEQYELDGDTENLFVKRWYKDFGILEHLLFDDNILEININPPAYKTGIRIVHAKYAECVSNIYPTDAFLDYLATRLKISTGRPLNKAQPQLDGEIFIEDQRARVAAIVEPFSIYGTAYSIRKHREHPWTLPLFIKNRNANAWFAGLMGMAIAHGRTFLTAGPRGSGKTSMLGALILEILPKYRIITIEDTQELPVKSYKKLGYDILPLKVRSALMKEGMELPFDVGLRTSLRLGDSCLIIGEVRSKEAIVLYEAMRVGAMANVVAGTIHGDSPYGVFDRVVNDLGVPKGSFKVTDLIVIQNQIKTPTGLSRVRRVMKVTEVLKKWEDEPEFQDLLVYNPQTDNLEPTEALLQGRSEMLKQILSTTSGYKNYDDVLKDIILRGWAKKVHVDLAEGNEAFLEAPYISEANNLYTVLFEQFKPLLSVKNEAMFKTMFEQRLTTNFHSMLKGK